MKGSLRELKVRKSAILCGLSNISSRVVPNILTFGVGQIDLHFNLLNVASVPKRIFGV